MSSPARNWLWKKNERGLATSEVPVALSSRYKDANSVEEEESYLIPSYTKSWESNEELQTFGDFEKRRCKQPRQVNNLESRESTHHELGITPPLSYYERKYPAVYPVDEDDMKSFGLDNGLTIVDLANDFSTGKIWEDKISPIDFVKAVVSGQAVKEIFPENDQSEAEDEAVVAAASGAPLVAWSFRDMLPNMDDEERTPVPHDEHCHDEGMEEMEGPSVSTFVNDLSSGKIWEDGSSPVDFVFACASGEVFDDFLGDEIAAQKDTSTQRRAKVKDTTPLASAWFGNLEQWLIGPEGTNPTRSVQEPVQESLQELADEHLTVQVSRALEDIAEDPDRSDRQTNDTSSRRQRIISPERRRNGQAVERTPGRPAKKTVIREIGHTPVRRRRLPSPTRKTRVIREYAKDEQGKTVVDVKRSISRPKGSRKSTTTTTGTTTTTSSRKKYETPQRRR